MGVADMAEMNLPIHPTRRHPLTGEPLQAIYVDRYGRARWPIMGAAEGDGDEDPPPAGGDDNPPPSSDRGFPEGTPLEQMTTEQREAYWKHQARKHEERSKAFGRLTPEELADLREKAQQHDALERELMSDKDKAVLEASETASAKAREEFAPRLVRAEFKAAAAGRIDAEALANILEPLDLTKFLDGDEVDEAKVAAYVESIAPVSSDEDATKTRRGPSATGAGRRTSSTGPSLQSGAELYQSRKRRG